MIKIKRIYEKYSKSDGARILVDRLWPRGIKKNKARIYLWEKELAPGSELRRWFSHDPKKFPDFKKRYRKELENKKDDLEKLKNISRKKNLTLLYAAKDEKNNNAAVLKEILESMK